MANPLPAPLLDELCAVADACADAARAAVLPWFRRAYLTVDDKTGGTGRFDPVTEGDRATEAAIRAVLFRLRPEDGILGEEEAPKIGSSGITWIIDPIDGTRAFMAGTPTWGVLIAAQAGAGPAVGVIDQPFTGERFVGVSNGIARYAQWQRGPERRPLSVRPCAALGAATLFTTFPEIGTAAEREGFASVAAQCRLVRYGLDCYAYALLAMGCIDLVIEAGLQAYDVAAPIAVIEGAGGIVTDWRGRPAYGGGRLVAAGDARVHAAALAVLSTVP